MNILLIYLSDLSDTREHSTSIVPSGLFTMASFLEQQEHSVTVANFSHIGNKKAFEIIRETAPDAIGISLHTHNRTDSLRLIREIRKEMPDITLIAGGPHADGLAEEIASHYPELNCIIRGEGEIAFASFLKKKPGRETVIIDGTAADLSSIPAPASFKGEMRGINVNEQFKSVSAGRGCSHGCLFCSSSVTGKQRYRSADDIIAEIETSMRRFGIIYFTFRDDILLSNRDLLKELCAKIQQRRLYIMWSCQGTPDAIDYSLLVDMKNAGCERVFLNAQSGSEKILSLYSPSFTADDIRRASRDIRKAGLYLSFYLRTGMTGEKHSDIQKTIKLIRETRPGEGIISPAVYYPGSPVCENAFADKTLLPSAFFNTKGKSIYIRNDDEAIGWVQELRGALAMNRDDAWYKPKDFKNHRRDAGDSWVCDILEGDCHLDNDDLRRAEECYSRVISSHQENPWGPLRMGKLRFRSGEFPSAETFFRKVTALIPAYYGGWLKCAEAQIAQDRRREARASIDHAWELNPWDIRILNLRSSI
ncbi:MAG: radical SAM protein [Spirochaetota bacterium]